MSDGSQSASTRRFEALQTSAYRKVFFGGLFTFLAMQVAGIARAWLAFDLTGTNAGLGGVMMVFGLASIVAIPTGGVLADRFSKRAVLIAAGLLQTATPLALGLAAALDAAAYWMLIAASLLQGSVISILAPVRLSLVAEVVERRLLTNAVFLSMGTVQFARVFGPAAAGALIGVAFFGLAGVFFAAAGLGFASVVLAVALPSVPRPAPSGLSALGDIAAGLKFVRSRPALVHLLLMSFGVVLAGFPHIAFLPVIAEQVYGAGSNGFGLLTAAGAAGALAATIALANVPRRRLRPFQARSALAFGLSLAVFAAMPAFGAALAAFALVGASSSAFQALNNSLVLTTCPVEYHGRVQSLLMLSYSGFAIASLPMGIVADAWGVQATMASMGAIVTVIAALGRLLEPRPQVEIEMERL